MTSQQPTRFENYPLEPNPGAPLPSEPTAPSSYLTSSAPAPPRPTPPRGVTSRRAVIAAAIGIPAAALFGLAAWRDDSGQDGELLPGAARVGDYSAALAENWVVTSEEDGQLVLGNGSNLLYAWADSLDPGTLAIDALGPMVRRAVPDIDGLRTSIGTAVDASDPDVQRVSLAGSGTLGRRAEQLIANIWISADGGYLFTMRILTDPLNSDAAYGAQEMIDELSGTFQ